MNETRKIAAILVSDVVGYSRLVGADEDRTLARLRALRSDMIDPIIAVHHGRVVKRTGDGSLVEFRSVVDAVRCAQEVQDGMAVAPARKQTFLVRASKGGPQTVCGGLQTFEPASCVEQSYLELCVLFPSSV